MREKISREVLGCCAPLPRSGSSSFRKFRDVLLPAIGMLSINRRHMSSVLRPVVFIFSLFVLAMPSCVSMKDVPLSSGDRTAMRGKSVAINEREMPELAVMTPGKMMAMGAGGAIGGAIAGGMAAADGKRAVEKHQVENPASRLASSIFHPLLSSTGAGRAEATGSGLSSLDPKKLAQHHASADYVLDVATMGWIVTYYPMTLNRYRVSCVHRMQLVETATGRVVAQGVHKHETNDKPDAPGYDEVFANGAAFLKRETLRATDGAAAHFKSLLQ
jgi:hypothetical protein